MQLHIRHETVYKYGEPVKRSIQNLRLTPRTEPSQRAISWSIHAPGRQQAQVDAHGNIVHLLTVNEPHRDIRIIVNGVVETADDEGLVLPDDGRLSPLAYLAETTLTRAEDNIVNFAAENLPLSGDRRHDVLDLAEAVCSAVRYVPGATEVHHSAAEAFTLGQGVCQDHAHIFISSCRSRGIPARYVSGYLYTGQTGEAASHAWADVWLGNQHGWVSVDVTHRTFANGKHCRLAVGRDYLDACPIRGVRRGGGAEAMEVSVLVSESAQQQQQQ
ncbi:MAG: transglutaminase family protein [Steroidobacteraceae bacterium]